MLELKLFPIIEISLLFQLKVINFPKTALIARKAKLFLQHIALAQLFILKTDLPKDKIFQINVISEEDMKVSRYVFNRVAKTCIPRFCTQHSFCTQHLEKATFDLCRRFSAFFSFPFFRILNCDIKLITVIYNDGLPRLGCLQ